MGTEWLLFNLINDSTQTVEISGLPKTTNSPYGDAVVFNGISDGIGLNQSPLINLSEFTVEALMRPDTNGLTEQRFLHLGEMNGERIMLETRLTNDGKWFLDAFVMSDTVKLVLKDSTKLHPLNEWYHVVMVNKNGEVEVFVNGKTELRGALPFSPFKNGKSSIGVRQNKVYWYKGAIYKIAISAVALTQENFLLQKKD